MKKYDRYKFVKEGITFFIYSNPKDLLKSYFRGTRGNKIAIYHQYEGKKHIYSKEDWLDALHEDGFWAYLRGDVVHLWFDKSADFKDVLGLVAHELGHLEKPYYGFIREEKKACRYSDIAELAYEITERVTINKSLKIN